jgi:ParB family transcriptional regulator, chromosome partitioning protein
MNPKNVLGRGLEALISAPGPEPRRVLEVEIHRLHPNPKQPRARFEEAPLHELARSIEANGILQPILVRPADGGYEIVAGERRWRAAQKAGLHKVPVLVKDVADVQLLELALVENLQREDLNPADEARAYQVLVEDLGLSQEEVARRVGKERATVANMLRLLNLPAPSLQALESGRITVGHAKAILSHRKREEQDHLLEAILKRGLSVREAEHYRSAREPRRPKPADPDTAAAARALTQKIGLPVEIRRRGAGGEVAVRFKDEQELDRLFEWLHAGHGRSR